MPRLSKENVKRVEDLIALYPRPRSALIPALHIAQEQDGWLTPDVMAHVAEMLKLTPAEVYGTATFYDMLFTEPVGRHLVSICTNIACLLNGGEELLEHAEASLGIRAGGTTDDGQFTLEEVECIALCGNPPCLTVNWRFFGDVTNDAFDRLVADLRAGKLGDMVPPHGTLNRVRRSVGLCAGGPAKGQEAPPDTEAAAAVPRGPAGGEATGRDVDPEDGENMETAARDAAEVQETGTSAPEPGSGERK